MSKSNGQFNFALCGMIRLRLECGISPRVVNHLVFPYVLQCLEVFGEKSFGQNPPPFRFVVDKFFNFQLFTVRSQWCKQLLAKRNFRCVLPMFCTLAKITFQVIFQYFDIKLLTQVSPLKLPAVITPGWPIPFSGMC